MDTEAERRPPFARVLALAPHPDDEVLGCGGTLAKWAEDGCEVRILLLSDRGEPTWLAEAREAARILHKAIDVYTLHQTVFHMESERQSIMRSFEQVRKDFAPEAVLAPSLGDTHQDHSTCAREAARAFKGTTLLHYEILRSTYHFRPTVFVPLSQHHVVNKSRAIQVYSTQRGKRYCEPRVVEALAMARGVQACTDLAEAFRPAWIIME